MAARDPNLSGLATGDAIAFGRTSMKQSWHARTGAALFVASRFQVV